MKYLITLTCEDTSEFEVEADNEEEAKLKITSEGLWDKAYPHSISQSNEEFYIDKLE